MNDREAYVMFEDSGDEALTQAVVEALAAAPDLVAERDGLGVVLKREAAER